jgi:hypothetical protein
MRFYIIKIPLLLFDEEGLFLPAGNVIKLRVVRLVEAGMRFLGNPPSTSSG